MATPAPVVCPLCNEALDTGDDLEHHLVYEHKPRELAKSIISQWEVDEFGDSG